MKKCATEKPRLSPTVFSSPPSPFSLSSPPPLSSLFSALKTSFLPFALFLASQYLIFYVSGQKGKVWAYTNTTDKASGNEEKDSVESEWSSEEEEKKSSPQTEKNKGKTDIVKEEVVRKQGEIIVLSPTRISRIISPKPIDEVITSAPISVEGISEREYLVRFLEPPASRIYEAWIVFQDGSQLLIFIKPAGDSVSEVEILESALEPTPSHPPPVNDYPTLTKGAVPGTPQTPYLDRIADILKLVVEGKLSEFEEKIKNQQDVSPYQELSIIPKRKWDFGERYVVEYLVFNKSGRTIRLREELFYLSSLIRAILLEKQELGPTESTRLLILFDEQPYPEEDILPPESSYQGGKGASGKEK